MLKAMERGRRNLENIYPYTAKPENL